MDRIVSCIEELRTKLTKYRKDGLKETPTRTVFINPLLEALGWDVRDPGEVELEYTTIDGKAVDYAAKINGKPVLFVEAKPLYDSLNDVKAITQVVGYGANGGVDWCILTNGVTYKVYKSTENVAAPDKLLFEISIDPKKTEGSSIKQVAKHFERFSKNAMAEGLLDEIGEQVFMTGKVRKALDTLFTNPPSNLIRIIRATIGDDTIKPNQIKNALNRIWAQTPNVEISHSESIKNTDKPTERKQKTVQEYDENHHLEDKPREIIELYRAIDKFCREIDTGLVTKKYVKTVINYYRGKNIFCSVLLYKSVVKIWIKLDYTNLDYPPEFARNVKGIGHLGVGDLELSIDSIDSFHEAKELILESYEKMK